MNESNAFIAIKPRGMQDGLQTVIEDLFEKKDNSSCWNQVTESYSAAEINRAADFLAHTSILVKLRFLSPSFGTKEWDGSFWSVNYADIRNRFNYEDYIKHFAGRFDVYLLKSNFDEIELLSSLALLKGTTKLTSGVRLLRTGKGIRGMYPSQALLLRPEINEKIKAKYAEYEFQTEMLFPHIPEHMKPYAYSLLVESEKDLLNSYNIHTNDTHQVLIDSLSWMLRVSSDTEIKNILEIILKGNL